MNKTLQCTCGTRAFRMSSLLNVAISKIKRKRSLANLDDIVIHSKLIYSTGHSFPFLVCLPGLHFLWATRRMFLKKQRTLAQPVHLVHAPSFFSGIQAAHLLLLLYMYDLSYFVFFIMYIYFSCLVFVPGLHFFALRITAKWYNGMSLNEKKNM